MTTKIVRADGVTEIPNIKSCTFTEDVNGTTDLRVGCVSSASIEVSVFGSQSDAPTVGEELTYYQVDENGVETKIGIFYAEPIITTKTSYSFIAYDAIKKLDVDFSEHLSGIQDDFPMTIMELMETVADVAGVTLASDISFPLSTLSINAFSQPNISCRQVFSWAAEIAGRFVRCNTDGEIIFDWYTQSNYSIAPSDNNNAIYYKQNGLTYENYITSVVDRVRVYQTNIDVIAYAYPEGVTEGNTYDVMGNLLLLDASDATYNAVAENIYNVLTTLGVYRPARVQLFTFNNPFRAGDKVNITDSQGVSFSTIIMNMTVNESAATLVSTGNEKYMNDVSSLDPTIIALTENVTRTGQHFWFQSTGEHAGAHITQIPKDAFIADPENGKENILIDINGFYIRNGLKNLAIFTSDSIQIGDVEKSHLNIDYHSLQLIDKEENTYFHVSDLRDSSGEAELTDQFEADGVKTTFFLTSIATDNNYIVKIDGTITSPTRISTSSFVFDPPIDEGKTIIATYKSTHVASKAYTLGIRNSEKTIGAMSFVEGYDNAASGSAAHAEGKRCVAIGEAAHAEGLKTSAIGTCSHAEGNVSKAIASTSHAEGVFTIAAKIAAHAEGAYSEASGAYSHAEGDHTFSTGQASHSQNYYTIASKNYQTAIGKYNAEVDDAAFIIGNGSLVKRSNALEVSWSGDVRTPGTFIAEKSTNTPALYYRVDNLDGDANPSSSQYYGIARAFNKKSNETNWNIGSNIWYYQSATGNGLMLEGGRYVRSLSASRYCGLRLLVNSSGNAVVQFSGNNVLNAWRDALGISQLASDKSWNPTINVSDVACAGAITSSMKQIYFLIPYTVISGTATVKSMSVVVRGGQTAGAEYIFAVSGASNNVYTQLGASAVQIWNNSASVRTNEIESITATVKPRIGIQISIMFKNALCRTNTGTTCYNNTPVNVRCTTSITLA